MRHIGSLKNWSSTIESLKCSWLKPILKSIGLELIFPWLVWDSTLNQPSPLSELPSFLGSAWLNLHFLASQGSLTALHAIIGLQLSVLVYPWWCAAIEWNSWNPSDTCDLILCWNDTESLRIMYSFLVCSSRSVSMEAFYPPHAWDCLESWGYEMMMS